MHPLGARRSRGRWLAAAACAAGLLAGSSEAATFRVNSTADTSDGACAAAAGGCTFREALAAAVARPGRDTVRFDPSVFPPGAPGVVVVQQVLPVISDPAGTAIDGAGAGVVIESGGGVGPPIDPLVFTSGAGAPLRRPAIANLTVRGFLGTAITLCGGELPGCDEDVSQAVVENVVATSNGADGVRIGARHVSKLRIAGSVAAANGGHGFSCDVESLAGTRIERIAARDNAGDGLHFFSDAGGADNSIADSIAIRNQFGFYFTTDARLTKTRLTNVAAASNLQSGIVVGGPELVDATIERASAASNLGRGIDVFGAREGIVLRGVVSNDNALGIMVGGSPLSGVTLTQARAAWNATDGIRLQSSGELVGNRVTDSVVAGNGEHGLNLIATTATGNLVSRLRAAGNNGTGILVDALATGNTIEDSQATANDGNGITIGTGSTGNVLQRNTALTSDATDLVDGSATCTNTWTSNVFESSSGPCIQ